ncbi:hypothetical protein J6590_052504 [Homalodisca vitripennis]|nr:hypothetical protein J6590_052504 [Homalodisca vitripennis]
MAERGVTHILFAGALLVTPPSSPIPNIANSRHFPNAALVNLNWIKEDPPLAPARHQHRYHPNTPGASKQSSIPFGL